MDTNEPLEKLLADQIDAISEKEVGSDERAKAIREYEIMSRTYNDQLKTRSELETMEDNRMNESIKLADARIQADRENQHKIVGWVFEGVKIVGGAAIGGIVTFAGFKFEEEGAFTSQTFKRIQDRIWKFCRL